MSGEVEEIKGKFSEVSEVLDRIIDAFVLFELLGAFQKSGSKVKEELENIDDLMSIPGNGREKDGLGAVYNELVKVFLFS